MCTHHTTAQDHGHEHHHGTADPHPKAGHEELAECPVMPGTMVVKADVETTGLYRDYEGQRYWLCCSTCESLFDANPTKYAHVS